MCEKCQDYEDDFKKVMSEQCAGDEKHCSCVPHLRRGYRNAVEQLEKQELIAAKYYNALVDIANDLCMAGDDGLWIEEGQYKHFAKWCNTNLI